MQVVLRKQDNCSGDNVNHGLTNKHGNAANTVSSEYSIIYNILLTSAVVIRTD